MNKWFLSFNCNRPAALVLLICVVMWSMLTPQANATDRPTPSLEWQSIETGLELAIHLMPLAGTTNADVFVAVRIEPSKKNFALCMASELGNSRSLPQWSKEFNLAAGINGGMYLLDKKTNIGYMRNGNSVNNEKIGERLGAFFVAGRSNSSVPYADIIDKENTKWRSQLGKYAIVSQNYRLMNRQARLLWERKKDEHSIAVIAKDKKNRILFVLCQKPLSVDNFSNLLTQYIPDISTVMYVEGGAQAGLFVRLPDKSPQRRQLMESFSTAIAVKDADDIIYTWKGRQSLLRILGSPHAQLPNVIGVKK